MHKESSEITNWILSQTLDSTGAVEIFNRVCDYLAKQGIPISRAATNVHTLHPQVFMQNIVWKQGVGCQFDLIAYIDLDTSIFQKSPVAKIYQGAGEIRRRLKDKGKELDFPVCEELALKGGTDYVIFPVSLSKGQRTYLSFMTCVPQGFSDKDIEILREIEPAFARRMEIEAILYASQSLMDIYLGKSAAENVYKGQVKKGDGKSISAPIWFCDLRDYSILSQVLKPFKLLEVLDVVFGSAINIISKNQGEVLKLVGDGLLAIFPGENKPEAAAGALKAAVELQHKLHQINKQLLNLQDLELGISLHYGKAFFGNVGSHQRLDFTIIGSDVNFACNLERYTKILNTPIVMSKEFNQLVGECNSSSLGQHKMKGLLGKVDIYGLVEQAYDQQYLKTG